MNPSDLADRALLLDSNLSVLLCVGLAAPQHIVRHKRLAAFDETDFSLLKAYAETAAGIVISPNVATETSNLLRQVANPLRDRLSLSLMHLVNHADERFVSSRRAVEDYGYLRLGLTDAAILHLMQSDAKICLLTTDLALYLAAVQRELKAINFNHLKQQRSDFN